MDPIKTFRADEVSRAIESNRGLLLLHFGSPLASSCELIHRQLETLAPLYQSRVGFGEVELPLQDLEMIRNYRIDEVPTLLLFHGQKEVERLDHVLSTEALKEFLDTALSFYGSGTAAAGQEGRTGN